MVIHDDLRIISNLMLIMVIHDDLRIISNLMLIMVIHDDLNGCLCSKDKWIPHHDTALI